MSQPRMVPRVKAEERGEFEGRGLAESDVKSVEVKNFEKAKIAKIVTYTGLGLAAARLLSMASAALLHDPIPLLSPEEVAVHRVAYVSEEGKAIIYSLGDPNDLVRVAEALWLTGYEIEVLRNRVEVHGMLEKKLEKIGGKVIEGSLEDVVLQMMIDAIKRVLEKAEGLRASKLRWEIETLDEAEEDVRRWFRPVKEASNVELITYTPSMEGPALLLAKKLSLPVYPLQQAPIANALALTTSAEEIWVRGYAGRCLKERKRVKIVSYPTDPLTAPIYFVMGLKLEGSDLST